MDEHPIPAQAESPASELAEVQAEAPRKVPWQPWIDQIQDAAERGVCLRIRGGGSKDHLGDTTRGEVMDVRPWRGIEVYEPSELVMRVRGGTPLHEVEAALAERAQHLAFEPPRHGFAPTQSDAPTIGGVVASGCSGPARVSRGAVRDHVLGCTVLTGRGQALSFGGAVMKNVAGFDLSRLMAGSMGTLGVILDVTLKVMPQPVVAATMRFELSEAEALAQVNQWAARPLPLDASAWWDGMLVLRLRGARAAVASAVQGLYRERRGELLAPPVADAFWLGLRDQADEFFARARQAVSQAGQHGVSLWRISVPPTTAPLGLPGEQLTEWFGALRWVCSPAPAAVVHEVAHKAGGHAQVAFGAQPGPLVAASALSVVQMRLHRQVQRAFDPQGVFDTGRLWPVASS
ncbi:MAG: glycolate oxidase subunit GlcE [Aquabacterium sp.]